MNNFIGADFLHTYINCVKLQERKEKNLEAILLDHTSMKAGNYVYHIVVILAASLEPIYKELVINAPTMINL